FFQAEDGIRDFHVTGVQTCALPIFFLVWSNYSWAQRVLTGKVTDGTEAIAGASVSVRGQAGGTSTDEQGNFSLTTDAGSGELVIRFLGFSPRTISFSAGSDLGTIVLTASDSQSLDEGVVLGRGVID